LGRREDKEEIWGQGRGGRREREDPESGEKKIGQEGREREREREREERVRDGRKERGGKWFGDGSKCFGDGRANVLESEGRKRHETGQKK